MIAGSRRWIACLKHSLPLKAILTDYNNYYAAIAQIRENEKHTLSSYSKGVFYSKLVKSKIITQKQLASGLGIGKSTIHNLLCFDKIPDKLMEAIAVPDKISGRSAYIIYALANKGDQYINALLKIADKIRDGLASYDIEHQVKQLVSKDTQSYALREEVINNKVEVIATWFGDTLSIKAKNSSYRNKLNKLLEILMSD